MQHLITTLIILNALNVELVFGSKANAADLKYALDLPHCKIPEVPLDNEGIQPEWNITFKELACNPEPNISVLSENGILSLTDLGKNGYVSCCYTEILRPEHMRADQYNLSECMPFPPTNAVNVSGKEFIFVSCRHKKSKKSKNAGAEPDLKFHSQLPITPAVVSKYEYWKFRAEKPVSVMILILDSVTLTHARRGLPRTMKFLEENGFLTFKAHHTMGEPTIENEVPMMLGTTTSDNWGRQPPHYAGWYDSAPFIWQNFSAAHYVTMDNEDSPLWHTFNFNGRKGFEKKPFDFYLRPYYLAQEKLNGGRTKQTMHIAHTQRKSGTVAFDYRPLVCMESQLVYNFLFDYAWRFLNVVSPRDVPSFSLSFLGWPQHDYLASLPWLEEPLLKLFQKIKDAPPIFENTVMIVMGDHGFRWANYSDTEEGLLERDLPLFMVRLPKKFEKKYPEYSKNMKTNTKRVTSHVDLFKTLAHLHRIGLPVDHPDKENSHYGFNREYGRSLFDNIPVERDCRDAKVKQQFCACNYPLYSDKFDYKIYSKDLAVEGISTVVANN